MRKTNKTFFHIILIIIILCIIAYVIKLLDFGAKYPLYDCVTYFDRDARFQIKDIGHKYYLYDAKKQKVIGTNIKYYTPDAEKVYFIFVPNVEKFGVLNILTEEFNMATDKLSISKEFSFQRDKMIDLTTKRNKFYEWFSKFIPLKLRKK